MSTSTDITGISSQVGGAVSDLFAGIGAMDQANLRATGLNINASGLRITAQGTRISSQGTGLNAEGMRIRAQGDLAEASNYDLAGALARENEGYTERSTAIQQSQQDRALFLSQGATRAALGGSGLSGGGSGMDILRDSASQGALARAVMGQQGLITEEGYEEQAKSYDTMSAASRASAAGEMDVASKTDTIAAEQLGIANSQDQLANQTDQLAQKTIDAGKTAEEGDFISGAIKGITSIALLAAL